MKWTNSLHCTKAMVTAPLFIGISLFTNNIFNKLNLCDFIGKTYIGSTRSTTYARGNSEGYQKGPGNDS
jgi:hypothetical protein